MNVPPCFVCLTMNLKGSLLFILDSAYENFQQLLSHFRVQYQQVAAASSQRCTLKVCAVRHDSAHTVPQIETASVTINALARVAATGALSTLVAASALLSASVAHAGADLALGKQVSRLGWHLLAMTFTCVIALYVTTTCQLAWTC